MKKVLFAAFESLPFIKTGGLADVVYALPKALDKEKFEVRVVIPLFKKIKERYYDSLYFVDHIYVNSGYINEEANIYSCFNEGIEYLMIENDRFFYRDEIYGFNDDVQRFCFFNVAVMEMMIKLDYYPDIIHTHDYHTAVIPALCKLRYNAIEAIRNIKHVFTIHNLVYQGIYDKQVLFDYLAFEYRYYEDGTIRFNDSCNFMKIGIVTADVVTTVSKTYAYEIQSPQFGENLDVILRYRKDDLYGIVNGIDESLFDPATDKIAQNYTIRNYLKGKAANKASLQRELGLAEDPDALLVGMVSRLTFQKGAELLAQTYNEMLSRHVQIVVLGTGESKYEYAFRMMEDQHRGQAVFYCGYNEALAHSIYAGIDMLLMPSLFEPCGISQLIAMRYGTLPLVRETGGLKDTVEPYNWYEKTGRGFTFGPYNAWDMMQVFNIAYDLYFNNPKDWRNLMRNAMNYDVSFEKSAREYEDLYTRVLER
ncbi:MAG: glycogen synthase [Erysipelotrichaceae bacterium]|nr:glycogen synthase [Erysipelotrichaceae bacterium]